MRVACIGPAAWAPASCSRTLSRQLHIWSGSGVRGHLVVACSSDINHSVNHSASHASPVTSQDASEPNATQPRTAWNKGHEMPAATRRKLSQSLKQKWKDPEHRQAVSTKLKGIEPWNKGRTLSEETRRKMSLAKLNRTHSKTTRQRMSAAHRGMAHSQETVDLLSGMMSGQPKTADHKTQIAAGQRRRHAAARVLRAVEAVYEAQGDSGAGAGAGSPPPPLTAQVTAAAAATAPSSAAQRPRPTEPGDAGAGCTAAAAAGASMQARLAAYRVQSGGVQGGGGSRKRKLSKAQILAEYKAELREYRALQDELSPWSTAFLEKHSRKPGMQDVVATGIPWLVTRYKQYILLRDRLFTDTGTLRSRLDVAIPDLDSVPQSINRVAGVAQTSQGGAQSSRGTAAAMRFSAVMEYKAGRKGGGGTGASRQQPAAGGAGEEGQGPVPSSSHQEAGEHRLADGQAGQEDEGGVPGVGAAWPAEESPVLGSNVPPRVRMAMMAAQEYRTRKAQAVNTMATAAATAAKARPTPSGSGAAASAAGGAPPGHVGNGTAAPQPAAAVLASGQATGANLAASVGAAANSSASDGQVAKETGPPVPVAGIAPAADVSAAAAAGAVVEEVHGVEDPLRRALQLTSAACEEMGGVMGPVGCVPTAW